ncbi:flagellar basal body rod protein FlgB [Nocardioides sp. CER19]|uniref:flagellar basal body rod protein FlgB n=1 Tax=Nocardioides sp. CER19 TaxID=3038538 RepID=UPI002449097B|nr:flagellar basal body rod protein FlgB [Nocardioides sp. CER19]MDH2414634.1 flagellar basal body rod protein FlgB [Nocardioides sp. CER19]
MSFAVSDGVSLALHTALNGLSQRQQVIADNIANVDTPGFRAQSIDFEDSLRSAIESGSFDSSSARAAHVVATEVPTDTPVGANGNNVDLRKETIAALQTQYSYQILGRAMTDHLGLLKIAAGS